MAMQEPSSLHDTYCTWPYQYDPSPNTKTMMTTTTTKPLIPNKLG
jgi:hypothetical protein